MLYSCMLCIPTPLTFSLVSNNLATTTTRIPLPIGKCLIRCCSPIACSLSQWRSLLVLLCALNCDASICCCSYSHTCFVYIYVCMYIHVVHTHTCIFIRFTCYFHIFLTFIFILKCAGCLFLFLCSLPLLAVCVLFRTPTITSAMRLSLEISKKTHKPNKSMPHLLI